MLLPRCASQWSPYPAVTCLVSCSPEGYEKLYLLGDGFSIFSYSALLGPSVDTRSCVSAGCLQTICGHFLREDGARILRSISKNDVHFVRSIISDSHLFELVLGDDFPRRFHYSSFAWLDSGYTHTSVSASGKMLTPIRVLVGGGSFARVSVARDMKNRFLVDVIMRLVLASMVFLRPCTFPIRRPMSFLTVVLSLLASKASITRSIFQPELLFHIGCRRRSPLQGVRACVELQLFPRVLCGIGHCPGQLIASWWKGGS